MIARRSRAIDSLVIRLVEAANHKQVASTAALLGSLPRQLTVV